MRRLAIIATGGALWLFLLAVPAFADNGPHVAGQAFTSAQGSCAGCHRAHSAEEADIVRMSQPLLCESCHGAGTAGATTDVVDGVAFSSDTAVHSTGATSSDWSTGHALTIGSNSVAGALKGGGFSYALITTDLAHYSGAVDTSTNAVTGLPNNVFQFPYTSNKLIPNATVGSAVSSSHTVDDSTVTIWGYGAITTDSTAGVSAALECTSCHNPHGNKQYRILRPNPMGSYADSSTGASNDTAWVYVNDRAVTSGSATTADYITSNYGVGWTDGTYGLNWTAAGGLDDPDQSALNADGTAIEYSGGTGKDPYGATPKAVNGATNVTSAFAWYKGTWREANSRWCATCHTRYFSYTGAAGNKAWTANGSVDPLSGKVDPIFTYRHAIRDMVDSREKSSGTSALFASSSYPLTQLTMSNYSTQKLSALVSYALPAGTLVSSGKYAVTPPSDLSITTLNGTSDVRFWIPDGMVDRGTLKYWYCTTSATTYEACTDSAAKKKFQYSYATGSSAALGDLLATSAPMCLTCHVSHGTNAAIGDYIVDSGATSFVTGQALDTALLKLDGRQACEQCHGK